MSLPKYFVRSADNQSADARNLEPFQPAHVVDSFFLGANHEWVVLTDIAGTLHAAPSDLRSTFPPAVQAELTYHELSCNIFGRVLNVEEFYLFDLQVLEQP